MREIESWKIREMAILLRSTLSHARGINMTIVVCTMKSFISMRRLVADSKAGMTDATLFRYSVRYNTVSYLFAMINETGAYIRRGKKIQVCNIFLQW